MSFIFDIESEQVHRKWRSYDIKELLWATEYKDDTGRKLVKIEVVKETPNFLSGVNMSIMEEMCNEAKEFELYWGKDLPTNLMGIDYGQGVRKPFKFLGKCHGYTIFEVINE